jgi:hypothetical protein
VAVPLPSFFVVGSDKLFTSRSESQIMLLLFLLDMDSLSLQGIVHVSVIVDDVTTMTRDCCYFTTGIVHHVGAFGDGLLAHRLRRSGDRIFWFGLLGSQSTLLDHGFACCITST